MRRATHTKKPLSPSALRRRCYHFVAGAAVGAIGLGVLGAALIGSDAGLIASEAIDAKAVIVAQSIATKAAPDGRYAKVTGPIYYDTFTFSDGAGQVRNGYDEVSLLFYGAHGVGASVDAYYYPEAPDQAVLGTAVRLGPRGYQYGLPAAGIIILSALSFMALNADSVLTALNLASAARFRRRLSRR
jgi:hypothetical protein